MKKLLLLLLLLSTTVLGSHGNAHLNGNLVLGNYTYEPAPAIPGERFTVWVTIENDSNTDAEDVLIELEPEPPFTLIDASKKTLQVGLIEARATKLVKYSLTVDPDAVNDEYVLRVRWGPNNSLETGANIEVDVLSRDPLLKVISSTPTTAFVGDTLNLNLVVENVGTATAFDASIGVSEDRTITTSGVVVERNLIPLGAAFTQFESLTVGERVSVSIPLVVNPEIQAKAYFIPIELTFFDSNKQEITQTDFIGLKVSEKPEFGSVISDAEPLPFPGSSSELELELYNTGLGDAQSLLIEVSSNAMTFKQSKYFIGSLESEDFDAINLQAKVNSSTEPGEHDVTVSYHYKDSFGAQRTETEALKVRVYSQQESLQEQGSQSQNPLLLYAAILVIAGLVYWFFLRKKLKVTWT